MEPLLLRLALVLAVVGVATIAGRVWQRRDGRVTSTSSPTGDDVRAALGLATDHPGPQAVLFGSDTCAPCDTVKALLRDVEATRDDFRWTYVDAAERLDLADQHGVRRVPTLLVLDHDGGVVARTSGVPARDELAGALPPAPATPAAA